MALQAAPHIYDTSRLRVNYCNVTRASLPVLPKELVGSQIVKKFPAKFVKIFKGLTALRLCKSLGFKGLTEHIK
jgi:hypothetical protein